MKQTKSKINMKIDADDRIMMLWSSRIKLV